LMKVRWPGNAVQCPHCGSMESVFLSPHTHRCQSRRCNYVFDTITGTMFDSAPVSMDKWLRLVWEEVIKGNSDPMTLCRELNMPFQTMVLMIAAVRSHYGSPITPYDGPVMTAERRAENVRDDVNAALAKLCGWNYERAISMRGRISKNDRHYIWCRHYLCRVLEVNGFESSVVAEMAGLRMDTYYHSYSGNDAWLTDPWLMHLREMPEKVLEYMSRQTYKTPDGIEYRYNDDGEYPVLVTAYEEEMLLIQRNVVI